MRITFDENAGLADTMPSDGFELLFGSIPGIGDPNLLRLRMQSCVIPGMQNEPITVTLHSFDYVFSGKNTYPKVLACTFLELSVNMPVIRAIESWQQQVKGSNSGTSNGYINDYGVDAELRVYDNAGVLAKSLIIEKLFPSDLSDTPLDGQGGQGMPITTSFSYWRAVPADVELR